MSNEPPQIAPRMQRKRRKIVNIHVEGDAYWAYFYMPPGRCSLQDNWDEFAFAHRLPVGAEYIYRAIMAAYHPQALVDSAARANQEFPITRKRLQATQAPPSALYEIKNFGTMPDLVETNTELPLLRTQGDTQKAVLVGDGTDRKLVGKNNIPSQLNVLVNWFGELVEKEDRKPPKTPKVCEIHVQVGLAAPLDVETYSKYQPDKWAKPRCARIIVVNVGELSETQRVRKSLSYEAIAVDLLRYLRGTGEKPILSKPLKDLSMADGEVAPDSVLAVRLNNSAVFLYGCRWDSQKNENERFTEVGAWLLCHKDECAPLSQPELGQMVGYTGFVSAQIAAAMTQYKYDPAGATYLNNSPTKSPLIEAVTLAVRRALAWQHQNFQRGCLHMLFKKNCEEINSWNPTFGNVEEDRIGYDDMFTEIVSALNKKHRYAQSNMGGLAPASRMAQFDNVFAKEVLEVPIHIMRAVAHRTQWFMARSVVSPGMQPKSELDDIRVREEFLKIATDLLCDPTSPAPMIPIVKIGKAELTDRREIEDFLAIHQALSVYSRQDTRPLNIAVFGSPGSGKSFAVRQVVQHIGEAYKDKSKYNSKPLTFNLGQFKSLDDLPAALHLVRNECLSREIPIVFFDEFDSSFQGQPFGWLKYFLAPMQDGEFYHAGQNYKLGHAVFVFAGGVNRSFEELNGRVRNPSFCEAKGPDFISRLKAHLNVQGINRSEEEADQGRYILRRGILLRSLLRDRLEVRKGEKNRQLLHQSVAHALLKIERFKHGVRSLEAIIKMCSVRPGHPIGPSDLPAMDQLEMHVDAMKMLAEVDKWS